MSETLIIKGGRTPTYLAVLDENGEMISGINDMSSISLLDKDFIKSKAELIKSAEYVVLDTDSPKNLEFILNEYEGETNFILDLISASKTKNVLPLIGRFHTIKPNIHEAEVIVGMKINNDNDLYVATEKMHKLGVKKIFITLDKDGVFYSDGIEKGKIKAMNPLSKMLQELEIHLLQVLDMDI